MSMKDIEMRRMLAGIAGLAGGLCAVSSPAAAQTAQEGINISASLDVKHDSNAARSSRASFYGLSRGDERATPAIDISVNKALGRHSLTLGASAGYDFYRRNKQLQRERLSLDADLGLVGGPCVAHIRPGFSRRQSDIGEFLPINIPGLRSVRNTATTQSYSGEVQCGGSYGFRPLVTATHAVGDNSEPLRRFANYRSNTIGTGVAYGSAVFGELALRFTSTDTTYPDRPAIFGDGAFSTKRVSFTGSRSIGTGLSGTAAISYIRLRPDQTVVQDFTGIGWDIALTAVPVPDVQIVAATSRDASPSLGNDSTYQINRVYSLGFKHQATSRMNWGLSGRIAKNRYVGTTGLLGPSLRDATLRSLNASVTLLPVRHITYTIYAGYQDRRSQTRFYNYSGVSFGLRTNINL